MNRLADSHIFGEISAKDMIDKKEKKSDTPQEKQDLRDYVLKSIGELRNKHQKLSSAFSDGSLNTSEEKKLLQDFGVGLEKLTTIQETLKKQKLDIHMESGIDLASLSKELNDGYNNFVANDLQPRQNRILEQNGKNTDEYKKQIAVVFGVNIEAPDFSRVVRQKQITYNDAHPGETIQTDGLIGGPESEKLIAWLSTPSSYTDESNGVRVDTDLEDRIIAARKAEDHAEIMERITKGSQENNSAKGYEVWSFDGENVAIRNGGTQEEYYNVEKKSWEPHTEEIKKERTIIAQVKDGKASVADLSKLAAGSTEGVWDTNKAILLREVQKKGASLKTGELDDGNKIALKILGDLSADGKYKADLFEKTVGAIKATTESDSVPLLEALKTFDNYKDLTLDNLSDILQNRDQSKAFADLIKDDMPQAIKYFGEPNVQYAKNGKFIVRLEGDNIKFRPDNSSSGTWTDIEKIQLEEGENEYILAGGIKLRKEIGGLIGIYNSNDGRSNESGQPLAIRYISSDDSQNNIASN